VRAAIAVATERAATLASVALASVALASPSRLPAVLHKTRPRQSACAQKIDKTKRWRERIGGVQSRQD
jgi:hypothetical protein